MATIKIAFMASGRGSNFKAVLDHIRLNVLRGCEVRLLVSNSSNCGALKIAKEYGVESIYMDHRGKSIHEYESTLVNLLKEKEIDLVVLAGWDWMVGRTMRTNYEWQLMAIHPSLHPSFAGNLLTAEEVHRAVLESGVKITGCTVYYVGVNVDTGPIILQRAVEVTSKELELFVKNPDKAVKNLAYKVLLEEHLLLSKAIQLHIDGRLEPIKVGSEGAEKWIVLVKEDEEWSKEWNERQKKYIEYRSKNFAAGVGMRSWQS